MIDCVWLDNPQYEDYGIPGRAFFTSFEGHYHRLTEHYIYQVQSVRKPIVVVFPARTKKGTDWPGTPFCIDNSSSSKLGAWIVTVNLSSLVDGQKPDISLSPSIKIQGEYHGYLKNGTITDDLQD